MVEMVKLGMTKYNPDWTKTLAMEYRLAVKYPNKESDTPEFVAHLTDNLWAYQIAHATNEGYTQLTPAGEEYLANVYFIYCDVVGIHPYTLKPLDGSEGDPEVFDDEDEDE